MNDCQLVSIITPCYNGETFVHRFFDSVLEQSYPKIELVFINDGSTDETENIALSYKEALETKGYIFKYVYQENKGQAAAVNQGLRLITGEYLTWPDSDDWMTPDCIERKVKLLEAHPEWAMLCCRTAAVEEDDISSVKYVFERKSKDNDHFFEDLILEKDVYYAPGGYMVRTEALMSSLKDGQIYEGHGGQNWQLMLPMAFHYQCGFVDDVLYYYLIRKNSHSRDFLSTDDKMKRIQEHEEIMLNTVERLKTDETTRQKYCSFVRKRCQEKRFSVALESGDRNLILKTYRGLKENGWNDDTADMRFWRKTFFPGYAVWRLFHLTYSEKESRH